MSEAYTRGNAAALGAADWLCLAAAPTFALMALLTGILAGGPSDMFCAGAQDASVLSGMVPMYVLMSAFHSAPWLKLISKPTKRWPAGPDPGFARSRCRTFLARERSQG